jgi:hypothetical protein
MHSYDSVVHDDLIDKFSGWEGRRAQGATLLDYITNQGTLEAAVAFASFFWPAIVEDDGLVILAKFYQQDQIESLKARFANDKGRIERWVNAWALRDFFRAQQFSGDPVLADEELVGAFGQALRLFWSLRLKVLFPTRTFIVEVGDDIEGEDGPTITFYETPSTNQA